MMHYLSILILVTSGAQSYGFVTSSIGRHLVTKSPVCMEAYSSDMSVKDLKDELRAKGLKVSGLKAELLARLIESSSDLNDGSTIPSATLEASPVTAEPPTTTSTTSSSMPFKAEEAMEPAPQPRVVHLSKKQVEMYTKDAPLSKRVFVANLDLSVANLEAQVEAVMSQHGAVASVDMGTNKLTGAAAPFCWVEFETDEGAASAVATLHGCSTSTLSSPITGKDGGALRVELSHQTGSAARARERNRCALDDACIEELVAERESQRKQGGCKSLI